MGASPYREVDIVRLVGNTAASQTDAEALAARTGQRFRVLELSALAAGTATDFTVNTKPTGSGVAISPLYPLGVRTPLVLPFNPHGWFETARGEGLAVTTGAGATVGWTMTVAVIGSPSGEGTSEVLLEDAMGSVLLLEDSTALLLEAA